MLQCPLLKALPPEWADARVGSCYLVFARTFGHEMPLNGGMKKRIDQVERSRGIPLVSIKPPKDNPTELLFSGINIFNSHCSAHAHGSSCTVISIYPHHQKGKGQEIFDAGDIFISFTIRLLCGFPSN